MISILDLSILKASLQWSVSCIHKKYSPSLYIKELPLPLCSIFNNQVVLLDHPTPLLLHSPSPSWVLVAMPAGPDHLFMPDEKWKLSSSKKQGSCRSRSTTFAKNSGGGRCSFTRRCANLVKEQRARFYIMRRCVTMLICWRDYGD